VSIVLHLCQMIVKCGKRLLKEGINLTLSGNNDVIDVPDNDDKDSANVKLLIHFIYTPIESITNILLPEFSHPVEQILNITCVLNNIC